MKRTRLDDLLMDIAGFGTLLSGVGGVVWAVLFRAKKRRRR